MSAVREHDLEKKIRIRSEAELELQAKGLIESKNIFQNLGIPYFLASGTLLGAYRNNKFIPWDWDVQCCFRFEDVADKGDHLVEAFEAIGFQLIERNDRRSKWKQVFRKYNTDYEFTAWYLQRKWRYRTDFRLPSHFFQEGYSIEFYNDTFQCFGPVEEYLEFNYGDWKVPKREAVKEKYLNAKFYRFPYVVRRIVIYYHYLINPKKALKKFQEILKRKI